ncbi:MAG: rod-binding protein [Thermoflexaceae bacterium]|nr:rod-binding protein [Thermoflexaceae bacterium]
MSISIDNALNTLNTYQTTDTAADKLSDTLSKDLSVATDDELMGVCKEFESYFLEQVFKSMQKMVPEHEYESSSSKTMMEYYQDELMTQYAKTATEKGEGLGLAQMLYEQMKRNYEL